MADTYDVVVIGAGPAGEHAAGRLAGGGLRVAVVERELACAECSYWGGIPSKTLAQDGLAGQEGTFVLCTFWLAQAQQHATSAAAATLERRS